LDIWDHDDEFSVFDAARKLNEVKGFKGLDRYFKQIAQSARVNKANKDSHVDDFLGSVNIKFNELPSNGTERWYELEGRTDKSKVEGRIRLRLKLGTREDRGTTADDDNTNDLRQQVKLCGVFINHELVKLNLNSKDWNGHLGREAETILHQHAIQGDVTDFQIAIWYKTSLKLTSNSQIELYIQQQKEYIITNRFNFISTLVVG
jgi:BAI1-associated protein 3